MTLREEARLIWQAGVDAVDSSKLVLANVNADCDDVDIAGVHWSAKAGGRVCVVGAGKAGAGMAAGLEQSLSSELLAKTSGWVNVPDDCVQGLQTIHLHGGRPAGVNEPTAAGVQGTQEILQRVSALPAGDLCIVLISGGGSALLPAPIDGISLEEKLLVTRRLMEGGVAIDELNCVRRALSAVKGGGLLRACGAGTIVTLIISDVIGSPLETIASGPTIDIPNNYERALSVLTQVQETTHCEFPESVWKVLKSGSLNDSPQAARQAHNTIIGDNQTAVDAAAKVAADMGYVIERTASDEAGIAREVGVELAEECLRLQGSSASKDKRCVITGGEPIVDMVVTDQPRKGGRNQELVLAAAERLWKEDARLITILSGGTDGEDGPTDAAGAVVDADLIEHAKELGLQPQEFLAINNAYPFFDQLEGLVKTGPTHTNVMDLRVALIDPAST